MKSDDVALVREFAASQSEPAFAALVQRHLGLVHSAALRQVGDAHLAEEIAQAVFIILARKAPALRPKTILSAWLYRTTRYAAADALKARRRRQAREQEAHMQSTLNQPDSAAWNQIAPLLDEALDRIAAKEHDALVLRFLDGKEMKQVGAAMGVSEDAARMRVKRGLEKLREFFTRKGVALSAAAIAGAVSSHSVQAAPAGLAGTIAASVLSGTALTTSAVIAATKTVAMTTLQKTLLTAAIAAAVGISLYETRRSSQLSAALAELQQARTDQVVSSQLLQPVVHTQALPSRGSPPDRLPTPTLSLASPRPWIKCAHARAPDARRNMRPSIPTTSTVGHG